MLYLRARYYNPADGRFQSRDTWGGNVTSPMSYNKWQYVYSNPANLTDPTGTNPIEWLLEQLRADTEKCYNAGDTNCVWRNYKIVATGGNFLSFHAAKHLNHFLDNKGTGIVYETALVGTSSAKWVMKSDAVALNMSKIRKQLLRAIWKEAKQGMTKSSTKVTTDHLAVDYDPANIDLYYGLGQFFFWAEADYTITGCYEVTVKPTYHFEDTYDWHINLGGAGGNIKGLNGFKDAWSESLVNAGVASPFTISGTWDYPKKVYTFNSNWLNLPRSAANDFVSEANADWVD